jgi:molybdenum cofactor cytidylyltransferase
MQNDSNVSVVILAAGFSNRMKHEKFLLMFDENKNFLEKIVSVYVDFNCLEIVVVLNSKGIELKNELDLNFPEHIKFVENKCPEKERFYSLQIGLRALNRHDFVFIQNIDNPFVNLKLLESIFCQRDKGDYIIPAFENKGGHPVLISMKTAIEIMNEKNEQMNLKDLIGITDSVRINVNDPNILLNINDYNTYYTIFQNNEP